MKAYHGEVEIKEKYVSRVLAHRKSDAIIQGSGWDGKRGCAVGCTLENYDHKQYPIELGIPIQLARIEDVIFEGLPLKIALDWPSRFLEAIPVGVNLEFVFPKFNLWILQGIIKHAKRTQTKKSIENVLKIYEKWIDSKKSSSDAFLKEGYYYSWRYRYADAAAADAAADAAAAADADADAADAAAAADADAADAAAADAAAAAAAAADAAAAAADAADAAADAAAARYRYGYYRYIKKEVRKKFWINAADKLIELLKDSNND